MNKKGFCWKRTVSVLLTMAMLITAAPQTGMSVYATGGGNADDLLSVDGITTQETVGDENDGNVDGSIIVPSDEENHEDTKDTDTGDSGNGGDNSGADNNNGSADEGDKQPANPDDTDQDGGLGDIEDEAEPEESGDELTEDEESMSMNDIGADVMSADEPMAALEKPAYVGEIQDKGSRLVVDENDAKAAGIDNLWEVLNYYCDEGINQKFDCVQIEVYVDGEISASNPNIKINGNYYNGAVRIMNYGAEEYWIDYNFNLPDGQSMGYSLRHPTRIEGNDVELPVGCTLTPVKNQGMKINMATTDFPVDGESGGVNLHWHKGGENYDISDCFWADAPHTVLMTMSGDAPSQVVPPVFELDYEVDHKNKQSNIEFDVSGAVKAPANQFEAKKDYLITSMCNVSYPLYKDTELRAGSRSGAWDGVENVTWKVLNDYSEQFYTLQQSEEDERIATLSTLRYGDGEYYSVSYTVGGEQYFELYNVWINVVTENGKVLNYLGYIDNRDEIDGRPYSRLVIEEYAAQENSGKNNSEKITNILGWYKEQGQTFNCIEFDLIDSSSRTIQKDYVNGAVDILEDVDPDYLGWVDFSFWNNTTESEVRFTLTAPYKATANVKATFTLTELANQGLKLKFATTAFPAGWVSFNYDQKGEKYSTSLPFNGTDIRLFKHSSGNPTAIVESDEGYGWYEVRDEWDDSKRTNLSFNNIKPLGTTEYLVTSLYWDEWNEENGGNPVIGVAKELMAGDRAGNQVKASELSASGYTSVTWKALDADRATIDKNGNMTAWSNQGPIYYYVKYKSGSNTYLEVHETWASEQPVKITLDQEKLTLNYRTDGNSEEEWLKVRYYPVGVDRNESRIKWEIEGGSNNVVSFVPDQDGVIRGGIRAEGPGTATVKVSYLAGDYNDEGKFVPEGGTLATATCEVTVAQQYTWEEKANEPINGKSIEGLYAILGIDETLAAIELPYDDDTDTGWTWDEPNTSLASFKGSYGHPFAATYTFNGVKQFSGHVWVAFVTPMGITLTMKNVNEERQDDEPEWYEGVPSSMWAGDALNEESGEYDNADQVTLSYQYVLDGAGIWDDDGGARYQDAIRRLEEYEKANYTVEWTSTPKDALEEVEAGKIYRYTASIVGKTRKAEKKTFTVTVKNAKNKAVYKASANVTVTVSPNYDFDGAAFENGDQLYVTKDSSNQMWLVVKVNNTTVEDYSKKKLTIASEDTAVLKLTANKTVINNIKSVENSGKGTEEEQEQTEDNTVYVKIPCTNPKPGTAWIKITAPDEMKNFRRYQIDFPDKEPKAVSATTVAINRAMTEENRTATVTVRTNAKYPLEFTAGEEGSNIDYLLNNKASESLVIRGEQTGNVEIDNNQYNIYDITVSLPDKDDPGIKNGKSTVTLNLKVKPTEDGESDELTYQLKLTVNVSNTVPKVTFKQTKKVNLFYTDNEGDGTLTFTVAGGAEFDGDPWLEDYVDVKKPANNAECNFVLLPRDDADNQYDVSLKYENPDGPDYVHKDPKKNKGIVKYRLKDYDGVFQANLTVSTETKKPTIVLSAKSDTLYPKVYYTNSFIQMTDKATGEDIFKNYEGGNQARYVVNAKKGEYIDLNVAEVDWDNYDDHTGEERVDLNNSYYLIVTPWGQITSRLVEQGDLKSYKTKADKITLEVKKANWADYISVPYSLTVSTSDPKLVLGKSTLTLNKNSGVYQSQQERTTLRLKGHTNQIQWDEWNFVTFVGQDDKSKKVLSIDGSLVLDYWSNPGDVLVSFNDNNLATGTYKFKISVGIPAQGTAYASTTLTVKVVDTPVSKNLKVTAKGSIDLMNIDGTSVTYTPKLSNLAGQVNGGWLEGKDADMFENWWDGSKLVVQARWGNSYSTKVNYQVYPVFSVEVQDYNGYIVRPDKALNIKVKQSKPKLTAAMSSNTIYRQLDNDVEIKLSAILGKKDVEIENVWLANYWGDFELQPNGEWRDDDGNSGPLIYNPETQSVRLKLKDRYNTDNVSVVQSGKTWKVKLQVQYANKAENEKVAEVTCSIVVR